MERVKVFCWSFPGLLVWVVSIGLVASRLTVPWAVAAAVLGAVTGFALSAPLARGALRLPALWMGGLVGLLFFRGVAGMMRTHYLVASLVGPERCYTMSEMLSWFTLVAIVVAVIMASSRRAPAFLVLEVGLVAAIVASVFAPHRDGLISRPYFLVDPLWGRGYDPLPVFLGLGALLAGILVLLLASRQPERRSYPALGILGLMVVLIFAFLPVSRLKDLPQWRYNQPPSDASPSPGTASGRGSESPDPRFPDSAQGGREAASPTPDPSGRQGGKGRGKPGDDQGRRGEFKDLEVRSESREGANQPVAVVLLKDDYDPPEGLYYFRQTVFSQWNGQSLVRDQSGLYDRDVAETFPEGSLPVKCEATSPSSTRALETVVALLTSHTRPFGLVNPQVFESSENPDSRRFQRAYTVRSRVPVRPLRDLLGRVAGSASWSKEAWRHYTEGPTDPRYKKLALEATATLKPGFGSDPLARALAIRMMLEKSGTYDLRNRYEGSADPVGDFLFGERIGYCVHFSRAAVYLFRSLGLPARVGTGYAVDARGRGRGSALMVRAGESHAWPELYLDGLGWVTVDISPAKSLVPPVPPPDPDTQQMMGDMARKKQEKPPDERKPVADGDLQKALRQLLAWLVGHLWWLVVLALAILYGVKAWRRVAPYLSGPCPPPTLYYRAALDALADSGRVRQHGETREGFARDMEWVSPSFARLTHLHLQEKLDRKERTKGGDPSYLRELYRGVRLEISAHTTLLRRVVGFLDPVSWWRVR